MHDNSDSKIKWIQCQYVNKSLHWICMKLLFYYAFLLTYSRCLLGTPHREFKMAANKQEMVSSLLNHTTHLLSNNRSNNTNQQQEKTFPVLLPESSSQLQERSLYFTLIYVQYICLYVMPSIVQPLCVMPFCMLPHCVTPFCIMPLCNNIDIISTQSQSP